MPDHPLQGIVLTCCPSHAATSAFSTSSLYRPLLLLQTYHPLQQIMTL